MTALPQVWGATDQEVAAAYPCDEILPTAHPLWRAVTVQAETAQVFRWLCQLRVAPYSYDLLDNLGRRSPTTLTLGSDQLAVGQRVMTIFTLHSFAVDRHLTLQLDDPRAQRLFGDVTVSYVVGRRRLVAKLLFGAHRVRRTALAWGDLAMMRKQLRTLQELAERPAGRCPRDGTR